MDCMNCGEKEISKTSDGKVHTYKPGTIATRLGVAKGLLCSSCIMTQSCLKVKRLEREN